MERNIILTNAPEAYDYRTARTAVPLGVICWHGHKVRMVRIADGANAEYQRDRYLSGLHIAVFTDDLSDGEVLGDPDFNQDDFVAWLNATYQP